MITVEELNTRQKKILRMFSLPLILPFHLRYPQNVRFGVISVYLSPLPVMHLDDAPRRRLVVKGDSARIQDETTESSALFFNVLGV